MELLGFLVQKAPNAALKAPNKLIRPLKLFRRMGIEINFLVRTVAFLERKGNMDCVPLVRTVTLNVFEAGDAVREAIVKWYDANYEYAVIISRSDARPEAGGL